MRKTIFLIMLLIGSGIFVFGQQINICMQIIKTSGMGNGSTLAPPRPWYITQDDYILTLPALADDYILELRDENGDVVYSTSLYAGSTEVILPATLSGIFELRLVADTYYYRGYINL